MVGFGPISTGGGGITGGANTGGNIGGDTAFYNNIPPGMFGGEDPMAMAFGGYHQRPQAFANSVATWLPWVAGAAAVVAVIIVVAKQK